MLKRIAACLIVKDGNFTRTKNFIPDHLYSSQHLDKDSFDEIIFINISNSIKNDDFLNYLKLQIKNCFLPVTIGGGIKKIEEVDYLFDNGADRIILNDALWSNPKLVCTIANKYGSQALVASIDLITIEKNYFAYDWRNKSTRSKILPDILATDPNVVGEILLQSVERDGSLQGFDKESLNYVSKILPKFIPLNLASGFGKWEHYSDALQLTEVDCICVQNVHHMSSVAIKNLKNHCINLGISIR